MCNKFVVKIVSIRKCVDFCLETKILLHTKDYIKISGGLYGTSLILKKYYSHSEFQCYSIRSDSKF